jgi:hypothetical protein
MDGAVVVCFGDNGVDSTSPSHHISHVWSSWWGGHAPRELGQREAEPWAARWWFGLEAAVCVRPPVVENQTCKNTELT